MHKCKLIDKGARVMQNQGPLVYLGRGRDVTTGETGNSADHLTA